MDCKIEICVRDTLQDFCDHHLTAKNNIKEGLANWKKSLGKMSLEEYYKHLTDDDELPIGIWAKEMASFLLDELKN